MTRKHKARHGGGKSQTPTTDPEQSDRRRWTLVAIAVIAIAAIAAYANSFAGRFLLDDTHTIVNSANIVQLWPPWRALHGHRPLVNLTLALNYRLTGLNVWGYHAFNLAIHVVAGLLLFAIVRRTLLMDRLRDRFGRHANAVALAVALIWTVHPLQSSSVTYITQRFEAMMAMFYLLTLYCAIRAASSRRLWWHGAAAASAVMGMASKEIMVTAPLVLVLYDRVFLWRSWRQLLRRRWELYAILAGIWLVLGVWIWPRIAAAMRGANTAPTTYAATQCQVIMHYLHLTFWPDRLCLDYWWPLAASADKVMPEIMLVLGLIGLTGWALWRRPAAGFLGAAFFMMLAPTSSFFPIADPAFEHRMYLPLAAVVVLVVCLAHMLVVRRLRPAARAAVAIAVVVAVAGGLGYRTARRNADYHDKEHMWREVVRCSPKNPRGHNNLGLALLESNRPSEAAACFKRALEADPTYAQAGQNLVIARSWAKDPGRAAEYLEAWLEQHPGSPVACQNLAVLLDKQGRLEEAIALYRQAIRLRRNYPQAHSQLGSALARLGCDAEAIKSLTKAIELRPHYADGHYNIGVFHARRGNSDQAQVHLQKALRLDSGHVGAHCAMGGIRLGQGHFEDAAACFARATELTGGPDRVRPLLGLALALAGGGDGSAAVARYRQVLAIDADNPLANNGLARLLATWPDPQIRNGAEAVRLAKKACQAVDNPDHAYLDTLAAAQAEIGQFDEAVRTMQQAISLVTQAGNTQAAKSYAAHLQLYQTGQCLREIPRQ